MTTIPTLNAPTFTPNTKVDFGTLGDLANTYQTAQAQKADTRYKQDAGDLAKRGYAVQMGLPDPGPSNSTTGNGGWLSNLSNYVMGAPSSLQQWLTPPTMIPNTNVATPTMTPAIPQASVPMPMARPQFG
jgi:hypothetical protein